MFRNEKRYDLIIYLVWKVFASRTHIIGRYVGTLCILTEHHRYIRGCMGYGLLRPP